MGHYDVLYQIRKIKHFAEVHNMSLSAIVCSVHDEGMIMNAIAALGIEWKLADSKATVDKPKSLVIDGVQVKFRKNPAGTMLVVFDTRGTK